MCSIFRSQKIDPTIEWDGRFRRVVHCFRWRSRVSLDRNTCLEFQFVTLKKIKNLKTAHKVALGAASIAAAGSLTIAVVNLVTDDGADQSPSNSTVDNKGRTSVEGDGPGPRVVCPGDNTHCSVGSQATPRTTFRTEAEPEGKGPWRYKVVDTVTERGDEGLKVRSCAVSDCPGPDSAAQIGFTQLHDTVWVLCQKDTKFQPGAGEETTIWLKVKWPVNEPNSATDLQSSRDDAHTGWMYSGFMEPAAHNGEIPECD